MKLSKIKISLLSVFVAGLFLVSCGGNSNEAKSASETTEQGKEYTSAYICPMHCEGSGSEEPGKCPVCGMAYVSKDQHSHSH